MEARYGQTEMRGESLGDISKAECDYPRIGLTGNYCITVTQKRRLSDGNAASWLSIDRRRSNTNFDRAFLPYLRSAAVLLHSRGRSVEITSDAAANEGECGW